jgi:hypothetical protein
MIKISIPSLQETEHFICDHFLIVSSSLFRLVHRLQFLLLNQGPPVIQVDISLGLYPLLVIHTSQVRGGLLKSLLANGVKAALLLRGY